jgi:hypothetical protein
MRSKTTLLTHFGICTITALKTIVVALAILLVAFNMSGVDAAGNAGEIRGTNGGTVAT